MMSMDAPERIFINHWGGERYWKSPAECPVEDDIEYIRADLALPEAVKRLVEAAKEARTVMDMMLDNDFTCFSDCAQWEKCNENDGGCLILARLEAALEAVEG